MAQLRSPEAPQTAPTAPTTPSASHGDPRWRNDASFTVLVTALALMVLTLTFWVG